MKLTEFLKTDYNTSNEFIYEDLKLQFSIQLKEEIDRLGISKKELANLMGVKPSYVSKIFGAENISLKIIAKVYSALNIEPKISITSKNEKATVHPNSLNDSYNIRIGEKKILNISDYIDNLNIEDCEDETLTATCAL